MLLRPAPRRENPLTGRARARLGQVRDRFIWNHIFRRMQQFSGRRGAQQPRVRGGAASARIDAIQTSSPGASLVGAGRAVAQPQAPVAASVGPSPFSYYRNAPLFSVILLALYAARLTEITPMLNVLRPTLLASLAALPLVLSHSSRPVTTGVLRHPVFRLSAGYGLWALATVPFALWPSMALESAIGVFIPAIILCFVILACEPTARNVDKLAYGLVIAVFIHVSYLLAVGVARAGNRLTSEGSLDPNDLGSLVAMSFPLAVGLAMRARGRDRAIMIVAALVFVFTLMRTGSRGGTIAFVAALLVFVAGFPARRRMGMMVGLVFAVPLAWTLGPPEYRERMKTMLSLEQDYNQTDYVGRKAVRERAQLYYKENLVTGVGMFCFPIAEGQHNKEIGRTGKWSAPHNAYWQALSELGTPGGVFFFGMLVTAVMSGLRCWRWRLPDGTASAFHRPEHLAAIVGFGIGAYFLSHAYFWPMFGFVALSGLAGLVSRSGIPSSAEAPVPSSRRRSAALGATGPSPVSA